MDVKLLCNDDGGQCSTHLSPYTTPLYKWRSLCFSFLCNDDVEPSVIGAGAESVACRLFIIIIIIILIIMIILIIILLLVQELRVLHGLCSALLEKVHQADL